MSHKLHFPGDKRDSASLCLHPTVSFQMILKDTFCGAVEGRNASSGCNSSPQGLDWRSKQPGPEAAAWPSDRSSRLDEAARLAGLLMVLSWEGAGGCCAA